MLKRIREDIRTVFAKDPAARTLMEVLWLYPGLHAVWLHHVAHFLWRHKLPFPGRLVSHFNRWLTGVEIHPGARIGRRLFIDHGMGVVIGETAEIGDDVLLYQGVVLAGTSFEKGKRHATIGNEVVIGARATLLGPISVGDGARIGAGSVVVGPVPAGATVVGVPGRVAGAERRDTRLTDLEHARLPDPVLRTLAEALDLQSRLEERVEVLERVQRPGGRTETGEQPTVSVDASSIREALAGVIDPETGVNVVDLGLIKGIVVDERRIEVRMVLCPGCLLEVYLIEQVRRKTTSVAGGRSVDVVLLDEAWSWNDVASTLIWGEGI